MNLFESTVSHSLRPLAERLRPKSVNEVLGQEHVLGENQPIGKMLKHGRLMNLIVTGPPGTGKTSFAMNENIFKGKWKEIKGEIVRSWGKITEDELEQTKGDLTKISGLVQQKYGETQESVRERLNKFVKNIRPDNRNEQPNIEKKH